jgi:Transposase
MTSDTYTFSLNAIIVLIAAFSNLKVSDRLVGDTLRKHNLFVRVCRRKPWLSRENRRKRKEFARRHRKWSKEWWRKHVSSYSNEVYLQIRSGYQRPTVRRPPGSAFKERYPAPTFTGDSTSIQFFAALSPTGHTSLIPI